MQHSNITTNLINIGRLLSSLLFLLLISSTTSIASAFVMSEGDNKWVTGLAHSTSTSYWNRSGTLLPTGCRSNNIYFYNGYEYGYSYYHTLFADTTYASQQCGGQGASGLTDIRLGIRGRINPFLNGRAWQVAIIIPTGYSRTSLSRIGYGRFGLEAGVAWSNKTGQGAKPPIYTWEVGAKLRLWHGPPADQVLTYIKGEYAINKFNSVVAGIHQTSSFFNGQQEATVFVNQVRLSEYEKTALRLAYKHTINHQWQITLSETISLRGRNAGKGLTTGLTLVYKWRDD
ncbi:MAG: hypothetical protein R8L53_00710 [Mariprofundales bacterium]